MTTTKNPILHNWRLLKGAHGACIVAQIYNDDRWKNGTVIRTSAVMRMDKQQQVCRTYNTVYELAMELQEKEI